MRFARRFGDNDVVDTHAETTPQGRHHRQAQISTAVLFTHTLAASMEIPSATNTE